MDFAAGSDRIPSTASAEGIETQSGTSSMRQKPTSQLGNAESLHTRAGELDALDAILPFNRREKLAELLSNRI